MRSLWLTVITLSGVHCNCKHRVFYHFSIRLICYKRMLFNHQCRVKLVFYLFSIRLFCYKRMLNHQCRIKLVFNLFYSGRRKVGGRDKDLEARSNRRRENRTNHRKNSTQTIQQWRYQSPLASSFKLFWKLVYFSNWINPYSNVWHVPWCELVMCQYCSLLGEMISWFNSVHLIWFAEVKNE